MRKLLPVTGAVLTIFAATHSSPAGAQDASAFADVPTSSWAYNAAAELQRQSVVTGWPMDYFSGKRTLTRYEFAIALKRALDKLEYSAPGIGEDAATTGVVAGSAEPHITTALLAHVRELVDYFKADLIGLHANLTEVNNRLAQLARRIAGNGAQPGNMPSMLRPNRASNIPLDTAGSSSLDLLRGNSGADFKLLPGPTFPTQLPNSFAGILRAPFAAQRANLFNSTGSSLLGNSVTTGLNRLGVPDTEFHFALPLTANSVIGVSLQDSLVTNDLLAGNPYHSTTYGTSISVHPLNRFSVGAEASRNVTERLNQAGGPTSLLDNNTYLLNIGYKSGPASAILGYRIIDPSSASNGTLNGNLLGISPTSNVQGPFTRIAFKFSDRLQSYVGGDYYANTGLRSGSDPNSATGSNPNSTLLTGNIYRGTAGIRWSPTRRISLTADYEGVLYDISDASSGRRLSPVEQYITLGAGLNLSRNAILKLAYQIYNQQDGSGSSDSPLGQNNGNTSVFTTQLAIHF